MDTTIDPKRYTVGTKVRLPERYGADGKWYPAADTVVIEDARQNVSGIWVCRVARWSGVNVRVDQLHLIVT